MQVFFLGRGNLQIVIGSKNLLFIVMTGEAQRRRLAAGDSQEAIGAIALDVFAFILSCCLGIPTMDVVAGKTFNFAVRMRGAA